MSELLQLSSPVLRLAESSGLAPIVSLTEAALRRAWTHPLATAGASFHAERQDHVAGRAVLEAGITRGEVHHAIGIAMIDPVESHYVWRPLLRDPGDEMILEAAVNGQATVIVTFNKRDFGTASLQFGVEVLTPAEALRRIKS